MNPIKEISRKFRAVKSVVTARIQVFTEPFNSRLQRLVAAKRVITTPLQITCISLATGAFTGSMASWIAFSKMAGTYQTGSKEALLIGGIVGVGGLAQTYFHENFSHCISLKEKLRNEYRAATWRLFVSGKAAAITVAGMTHSLISTPVNKQGVVIFGVLAVTSAVAFLRGRKILGGVLHENAKPG